MNLKAEVEFLRVKIMPPSCPVGEVLVFEVTFQLCVCNVSLCVSTPGHVPSLTLPRPLCDTGGLSFVEPQRTSYHPDLRRVLGDIVNCCSV